MWGSSVQRCLIFDREFGSLKALWTHCKIFYPRCKWDRFRNELLTNWSFFYVCNNFQQWRWYGHCGLVSCGVSDNKAKISHYGCPSIHRSSIGRMREAAPKHNMCKSPRLTDKLETLKFFIAFCTKSAPTWNAPFSEVFKFALIRVHSTGNETVTDFAVFPWSNLWKMFPRK